ncbi:DUF3426 domain-containing protein [Propionivibrio sp.]|uniref:DUF3426 domain-containing protein n=1 Tax=Propionivibrio sp. TaxID=2212460 RepID=UPI003BF18294
MKTRCPACETTFRVTPEQLKARAGKVRCGQCQSVFNALDSLLDETNSATLSALRTVLPSVLPSALPEASVAVVLDPTPAPASTHQAESDYSAANILLDENLVAEDFPPASEIPLAEIPADEVTPLSESAAQELGKATGLILPRETTEIPGYSKWAEGVMSDSVSLPAERAARWPFILTALILIVALAGQIVFRFRSEIAITVPGMRPILEALSQAFDADLPLPRHVELVSIETSDLLSDPARGNLLILNATLRNRANYGQAYPSLELSLTDTQDAAIARRIFHPGEYLSPKMPADQPFAANSDIAVRLWIETTDISAAGYRLYVFYP